MLSMVLGSLVSTPLVPLACVKMGLPSLPTMATTQLEILLGSEVASPIILRMSPAADSESCLAML